MFDCYGWVVLRSARPERDDSFYETLGRTAVDELFKLHNAVDAADRKLFGDFQEMMEHAFESDSSQKKPKGFLNKMARLFSSNRSSRVYPTWYFHEQYNNVEGVLLFFDSRNHRSSVFLDEILPWVAKHGPGSFGVCFARDDEDHGDNRSTGRIGADHTNVFRVFRLANGELTEHDDPFLSPIFPRIVPHPYWR
jgi:hypothetical protein